MKQLRLFINEEYWLDDEEIQHFNILFKKCKIFQRKNRILVPFHFFNILLFNQKPTIKGYASRDGDPAEQITGQYQPCGGNKTRADYDLCLSHERAKLIANILNKGLPELDGAFQFKGMGETAYLIGSVESRKNDEEAIRFSG